MGKFDGMDPALVRDLLAETSRAAVQIRTVEGRITQLMSGAGLATPTTHRPAQVADACEEMVRDVTSRLALLEKKEPDRTGDRSPSSGDTDPGKQPPSNDPSAKDPSSKQPSSPEPAKDTPTEQPKADPPKLQHDKVDQEVRAAEERKPVEVDSSNDKTPPTDKGTSADTERDKGTPADPEKDKSAPADAGKDKGTPADTGRDRSAPADPGKGTVAPADSEPGKDVPAGTERDTSVLDTPKKDHPDDADGVDGRKPQVVMVDGVKVLQVPLNPPTADELAALLENADDARPMDMPTVSDDTRPGQVDPSPADPSRKPDHPLLDTVGPANDQTIQPPDDSASSRTSTGGGASLPGAGVADSSRTDSSSAGPGVGGASLPGAGMADSSHADSTSVGVGGSGASLSGSGVSGGSVGAGVEGGANARVEAGGGGTANDGAGARAVWVSDGSDVVSVDVQPPSPEALKVLADNAREIEPLDMPDVRVPAGEWGKGQWVPEDIRPDGPAGSVAPGTPNTPIDPPGQQAGEGVQPTAGGSAGDTSLGAAGGGTDHRNDTSAGDTRTDGGHDARADGGRAASAVGGSAASVSGSAGEAGVLGGGGPRVW
ncbi:hypothetical protein [Nonomuraea sp. NPDC046570]|uniref:hypothetical protein n=1 Tax=Nonomuraea sp. NPDC046570 TaxID=3155255 RepID=UPI0033F26C70